MRWLIRTVMTSRKGVTTRSDDSYSGSNLTIGRSAANAVFLSDLKAALEHARVVPLKANRYRVESLISSGVRVDGKLQSAAGAGVGSKLLIGATQIEFIKAPDGYDAAVEISEIEQDEADEAAGAKVATSLAETWLGKRGPAWLFFVAFLAIGLIIPIVGDQVPAVNDTLRSTPGLPSDGVWESGTLQAAHHFFGENCELCHAKPFQSVRDEQCIACHTATPAHADDSFFDLPALTNTPCAKCHKDHNGLDGLIVDRQALCTDCHANLDTTTQGKTLLANASDFTHDHPQFKVELAGWDADGNYAPRRELLGSPTLSEDSNLKFPHDVHLAADGIAAPSGERVLACADCHAPEPGGALMEPVAFDTMCHECHTLGFDPAAPDRQVPHGNAAEVVYMLEGYYADKALRGTVADASAPQVVRKRRRPGEAITRQERLEITQWSNEAAMRTAKGLFEGQACGVCHDVSRVGEGDSLTWNVAKVRIQGVWHTDARFTHQSHVTMNCESCHAAGVSDSSNDVLLPGIDTATWKGETVVGCRDCHGGEDVPNKVASPCIDCHQYHGHTELTLAGS
ncbi:MAG: cytochrome c3 family protein [Pseudomonadota bacterium]